METNSSIPAVLWMWSTVILSSMWQSFPVCKSAALLQLIWKEAGFSVLIVLNLEDWVTFFFL